MNLPNEGLKRKDVRREVRADALKRGNHISAEGELRYRMIPDKEHPTVQHRLAEIHLAKIGKLDRGEQLVEELTALQTDDQAA